MAFRRLTFAEMQQAHPYVREECGGADLTFSCLCGRDRWFEGYLGTLEEEIVQCPDSVYFLGGGWEWHEKGCGRAYRLRLEVQEPAPARAEGDHDRG